MNHHRRAAWRWGLVAAALVASMTMASCSSSSNDSSGDGEGTVTLWSWRTEDKDAMTKIFKKFEDQNPDITVKLTFVPDADYQNTLSTALRGGKGPDIPQLKAYGELQPLVDAGYLDPLDDKVSELADFPDVSKAGAQGIADKKMYGVPYSNPNMGVFYNTDIFAKNNISVPTTYAEFLDACKKLQAAGVVPIAAGGANGTAWALEILIGTIGPNIYGADFYDKMMAGETDFNDPKFVATLQRIQDLAPYYSPGFSAVDYTTATQQFVNQEAAMFIGGSWENGSFKSQNSDLKFSIFSFPADNAGEKAYTSTFVDGSYGLNADSKNKDAATKVLTYMASKDFEQQFADDLGWPPSRSDVTPNDATLKQMYTMSENSTPYLTLVGFRWQSPTASSILQAGLVDMIEGKTTPAALAKQTADGVKPWFKANTY